MRKHHCFTLIELLVLIAIIALLMVILQPAILAVANSPQKSCSSTEQDLAAGVTGFLYGPKLTKAEYKRMLLFYRATIDFLNGVKKNNSLELLPCECVTQELKKYKGMLARERASQKKVMIVERNIGYGLCEILCQLYSASPSSEEKRV